VKVSPPNSSLLVFMVGLADEIVSLRTFPRLKAQEMGLEKAVSGTLKGFMTIKKQHLTTLLAIFCHLYCLQFRIYQTIR